jgi:hypothetical protein
MGKRAQPRRKIAVETRPVTPRDLNPKQRAYYEAIPEDLPELRQRYLMSLPDVRISVKGREEKLAKLRALKKRVETLADRFAQGRDEIAAMIQALEQGGDPGQVDLRKLHRLFAQEEAGVTIHFHRDKC